MLLVRGKLKLNLHNLTKAHLFWAGEVVFGRVVVQITRGLNSIPRSTEPGAQTYNPNTQREEGGGRRVWSPRSHSDTWSS